MSEKSVAPDRLRVVATDVSRFVGFVHKGVYGPLKPESMRRNVNFVDQD